MKTSRRLVHHTASAPRRESSMMQCGSVTGAFTVYKDFPTYTSGMYHHARGSELGGHAIMIFG